MLSFFKQMVTFFYIIINSKVIFKYLVIDIIHKKYMNNIIYEG